MARKKTIFLTGRKKTRFYVTKQNEKGAAELFLDTIVQRIRVGIDRQLAEFGRILADMAVRVHQ